MAALWVLIRLRLLDTLRSRSSAAFVFLFPLVLLSVVGVVFMHGHPFERRTLLVVESAGPAGNAADAPRLAAVRERLKDFDEVVVEAAPNIAAAEGKLRARMASAVLVTNPSGTELWVGPRERLFGDGLIRAVVPLGDGGSAPKLVVQPVPRRGYVHYLFPGLLTFSVLLSGLFGMGYVMVSYRQSLFLKKLATTQLSKSSFVLAQIVSRSVLVLGQNALLLLLGYFAFELPLSLPAVGWLALISTLGLLTFMGLGFVLACFIRTEELMMDIISSVNVPIVFLSELFFPLAVMPRALAWIGGQLPSTQMVRLCRAVLLYGDTSLASLGPGLALLSAWSLGSFGLSLWVFKWHR